MATKKTEVLEITPIEVTKFNVRIIGDTPLIMHAWSEKAKREILGAQQFDANGKKIKIAKEPRNPVVDFINSMYWMTEKPDVNNYMKTEECEELFNKAIVEGAKFGFPVTAFKQAAISASYRLGWTKDKMSLRGVFYIDADENGLVEIKSDVPEMREDMVKIGMGTADIRYRGEFKNWYTDLTINYNANGKYTLNDIVNIINAGGYVCGVGEWRPERDGQNGMFHIQAD